MVSHIFKLFAVFAVPCLSYLVFIAPAEAAPANCQRWTVVNKNIICTSYRQIKQPTASHSATSTRTIASTQVTSINAKNRELLSLVNNHRRSIGKKPFVWNSYIEQTIKGHVQNISKGSVAPGHTGSKTRYANIYKAVKGTKGCSEVVGWVKSGITPQMALNGWLGSPGHRKMLESDRQIAGFAIIGQYAGGIACAMK